jgi:hypothetical protein
MGFDTNTCGMLSLGTKYFQTANYQSPDTFPGSETGTNVTLGFGSYQVNEDLPNQHTHLEDISKDCTGVIHPDETKTCTITNLFNPQS